MMHPRDEASSLGTVTVVIPVFGEGPHLERVVTALLAQTPRIERIIVSHSGPGDPTTRFSDVPEVTVLHSAERLYAGAARNRGLAIADTEWVAFIDEDVIADRSWHAGLLAAIGEGQADCIVGSVGYAETGGYWGMCVWFIEFGSVHPYLPPRDIIAGPSANIAIRRSALVNAGGFPEHWRRGQDAIAQMRLRENGAQIVFSPQIKSGHVNLHGLRRMISHLYDMGRSGCRVRRNFAMPGTSAANYPVLTIALLPARLLQMTRRAAAPGAPLAKFLACFPGILVGLIAWNVGFSAESFASRRTDISSYY
ncbi:glycosyltransferase [Oricola cellulosilytica]|nr:glycosyltransferase family A protein [Oricola cellulosilytica]